MRRFGVNEALIEAAVGKEAEYFAIWPENAEPLAVFLRCRTQWAMGAMGGWFGLHYEGVEIVMLRMKVKDKDAMFELVQVMELAALPVLNGKNDD